MEYFSICQSPRFGDEKLADFANDVRDRLASGLRTIDDGVSVPASRLPDQPVSENDVRAILKARRQRDLFFEGELFADPAWDILLDLYAAMLGQQRISVGNLCIASAVPATTALRWISVLESKGLVEREADQMDGRRYHLSLTGSAFQAMARYFRTFPAGARLV